MMRTPESPLTTSDDEKDTRRTEAFSDGVFAIAITLLALEIRVPTHEETEAAGSLLRALLNHWPSYFAFFTSFLIILIMWVNHHRLFKMFRHTDHIFLLLNGLLLMGISLVPFTSALWAEYIDDEHDAQVATIVYAAVFVLTAVFFNALWRYASYKRRLIDPGVPQEWVDAVSRAYRFGPLFYAAAGLLSLVHVALGAGLILALAIFFALPSRAGETLHVH
jgi:uncharacterized membrane protein